jgi:hypothetical protein
MGPPTSCEVAGRSASRGGRRRSPAVAVVDTGPQRNCSYSGSCPQGQGTGPTIAPADGEQREARNARQ